MSDRLGPAVVEWLWEALGVNAPPSAWTLWLSVAAALLIALWLVLPRGERRYLRAPAVLLLLHAVSIGLRALFAHDAHAQRPLGLAGLFFLLASLGRSSFLLLVHAVPTLRRSLPRIVQDFIQVGIYILVALVTLRAAGVEPSSLLATSALLTAVIGLSLQDTLGNMFAGLAIQVQRPFGVGDWIQFDDLPEHVGQVIEINWRATKVLTLDRVEVTVPNGVLAKAAITNYSQPSTVARSSAYVVAPYHAPPARVRQLLAEGLREVPGVLSDPEPSVVVNDFNERGIQYWVRYFLTDFSRRDLIAGQVRERLWYSLSRAGYRIPPPLREVQLFEVSPEAQERKLEQRRAELERALKTVDFLEPLPPRALRELAERAAVRLYNQGEVIIRQGESGDELFLVEHGEVCVNIEGKRGPVEVARLGPGNFFGEMSLMTGEPRSATVLAAVECELIVVKKESFQHIIAANQHVLDQ
ncbi:MAG TPA: mechanosensitive ion channel family protein, partial [Polyangiaceae bacterium]